MYQIAGAIIFLLGILCLIYNKRSAEEYSDTWGRRLKHGYVVGRFISIFGGILCLLLGMLMVFVKRP
jgi:hypothetical protein